MAEDGRSVLAIEGVEMIADGKCLCNNQVIFVKGIYGIGGLSNAIRRIILDSLTNFSLTDNNEMLNIYGDILYNGNKICYDELQDIMNQYKVFYSSESVRHSLEFINFRDAEKLMDMFDLTELQDTSISELSISESRLWETAINLASSQKVIILRDFQAKYSLEKKYLSALKSYSVSNRSIILVETEYFMEFGLDGCVFIKTNEVECVDFHSNAGIRRFEAINANLAYDSFRRPFRPYRAFNFRMADDARCLKKSNVYEMCRNDLVVYKLGCIDQHIFFRNTSNCKKIDDEQGIGSKPNIENQSTYWLYSMSINTSLALTRRRCVLEEKKRKRFKRGFFSFSIQVCILLILKLKYAIINQLSNKPVSSYLRLDKFDICQAEVLIRYLLSRIHLRIDRILKQMLLLMARLIFNLIKSLIRWLIESFIYMKTHNWSLIDYKIISTGIYLLVLTRGSAVINEEKAHMYCHVNKIYSPGTYFFHIFIYLVLKIWIPVLAVFYILNNIWISLTFLATGTFVCILINLTMRLKLKCICICIILSFNLLYPLDCENISKSFFLKYSESFNFFVACRELPFSPLEKKMKLFYRLLRAYLCMYVLFCYKLSKY
ncbi:hypothetical protein OCOL_000699 [Ordospora colligata]|uniref:ABC transporter domain-containing protein n=1 Tax=Ordospora colligata OC4 TaxID=1354746 RepID=A0A0B2UMR0_9MICR|nr:uncharacterized protein M896_012450 [Ordospora colligata OC4]KHN70589.1 hypothetical protein M896_012450 [Ordospora colligata OC4]TBU17339.1 hypothetical protein CWI41_012450 [Ordospora colligata]TBU17589.1 hypothetical protein CWI40_012450 [Ordospora colligata]